MATSELFERARRAEDDYFRRKDAELLAKARTTRSSVDSGAAVIHERRLLGDALGLHDTDVVFPLHEAGLRAATVGLLEWMPAIEVAWVDGVDAAEREELSRRFEEGAGPDGVGVSLINEWLFSRPSHEAMDAARRALRHRVGLLDADSRADLMRRIATRCEIVGRASGGWFGLGMLSDDERETIDRIREGLGDETVSENPLPSEIPH
ncbi:MAG: hypothetical protein U0Q11_24365 [Vicinamibacterales bacterium]